MGYSDHYNCLSCGARVPEIDEPCPACGFDNRVQHAMDAKDWASIRRAFLILGKPCGERMRRGRGVTLWRFQRSGQSGKLYAAREDGGAWRRVDERTANFLAIRCDWIRGDAAHVNVWREMQGANAGDPQVLSALATLLERAWGEVCGAGLFPAAEARDAEDRVVVASLFGVTAARRVDLNRDWDDGSRWVTGKVPMYTLADARFLHCLLLYALTFSLAHDSVGVEGVPESRREPELYRTLIRAKKGRLHNVYLYVSPEEWRGEPTEGFVYWDYRDQRYISVGRASFERDGKTWYMPDIRPLAAPPHDHN